MSEAAPASTSSGLDALRAAAATAATDAPAGVDQRGYSALVEAYLWGLPLVTMLRTRAATQCLAAPNALLNAPALTTPSVRLVVTPNVDTLYSNAWLDLRNGPVRLQVPAVHDRYYVFQFLDLYTNTITNVGSRTNGGRAGTYMIIGPGSRVAVPAGTHRITSPTPDVWLIGRTLVRAPADVASADAVQRGYVLQPPRPSPRAGPCAAPDTSAAAFYRALADGMAADPAPRVDAPVLADLATGGVQPGRLSGPASDPATLAAAQAAAQRALGGVRGDAVSIRNGWVRLRSIGTYGTEYLSRTLTAQVGLGANVPAESVYYSSLADQAGAALTGARSYTLHFGAGGLPPIGRGGFWSVTLYGPDHFLVANSSGRYAVGDRSDLQPEPDGSVDVRIAAQPPTTQPNNWLPAPAGPFTLVLRAYVPGVPIQRGTWTPPVIQAG